MKYQEELDKADELAHEGNHLEAAKLYEQIGTQILREGNTDSEERRAAPKIIAKSIGRYLIAEKSDQGKNLAYQVLFMKEEDPFLSLVIESAISPKKQLVRMFYIDDFPDELTEKHLAILAGIPQNRKILKIDKKITIKNLWEYTIFGEIEKKYDLIGQQFPTPKEMVNSILSIKRGIQILLAEIEGGERILAQIALTLNDLPIEIIKPAQT
ncbi:MAG: hypothetical protein GF308_13230 [Candidatus Heimdallarchaeota archaeon]|nr:hypothetical protein [Candidatus Heimdallarchaeota archaeon]